MEVLQAAEFLLFAIPTPPGSPEISLEFLRNNLLITDIDGNLTQFLFEHNPVWPIEVAFSDNTLRLRIKKDEGNWTVPVEVGDDLLEENDCFYNRTRRRYLPVTIEQIKSFANPNVCELTVLHRGYRFNYNHPGHFVTVSLKVSGKKNQRPYYPTVDFPIYNLTYPNKRLDEFEISNKPLKFLVNDYGTKTNLHNILCTKTPLNRTIYIAKPRGGFCLDFLTGYSLIYVFCESSGVAAALPVIFHILQTQPSTPVRMYYFNDVELDILYKDELEDLAKMDERFSVVHILRRPRDSWKGWKGRPCKDFFKEFVTQWSPEDNPYAILGGHRKFVFPVGTWLITDFGYPNRSLYRFMTM